MNTSTRIALIRHGQTSWNAEARIQGRTDIELNDVGRTQAAALAPRLGEGWDLICASPLSRAFETASILAEQLSLPPVIALDQLIERDFGQAEGLNDPQLIDAVRCEGGFLDAESDHQVGIRSRLALEHIVQQFPGKHVLAVTHGSYIRLCLSALFQFHAPRITNTAVSVLEHSSRGWMLGPVNLEQETLSRYTSELFSR